MKVEKQRFSAIFHTYIGHLLVIGFMVGGYIYNVKFIQVGIPHLGEVKLGISPPEMGGLMALLAIITTVVAIIWGIQLGKLKWNVHQKIDAIIVVGIAQLVLTLGAPLIPEKFTLTTWIILTSTTLGFAIPLTFPLLYELIPTKHRGLVAGFIAGLAYLAGNWSPAEWTIESLATESLLMIIPGLGIFLVLRLSGFLNKWIPLRSDYAAYEGRFTSRPLVGVVGLMFIVFFIDSLGFMRIISTPALVNATWQAPFETRAILGVVHFVAGVGAGYLYSRTDEWIIGIIALGLYIIADGLFSLYTPAMNQVELTSIACLYCATVSVYTVNNFAIWADISTRENVSKNAALGIGIGGWLSSFLSTTVAFQLATSVPFATHLLLPAILAAIALTVISLLLKNKSVILLGKEPKRM